MAITPQTKQVAEQQASWEQKWKDQEAKDKDVSDMFYNPQGAYQLNIQEVEKFKKVRRQKVGIVIGR